MPYLGLLVDQSTQTPLNRIMRHRPRINADGVVMKICSDCGTARALEDFPFRDRQRGSRRPYCKPCLREKGRERNKQPGKNTETAESRAKRRRMARHVIWSYLMEHPCVNCGETDPIVLEFDHINPEEKKSAVSSLIGRASEARILEEIRKCVVRCANCHRKHTAAQLGWWNDPPITP